MFLKPWTLKLFATDSSVFSNTSSGTVVVPGKRMCEVGGA
jgi:hypothetical protein